VRFLDNLRKTSWRVGHGWHRLQSVKSQTKGLLSIAAALVQIAFAAQPAEIRIRTGIYAPPPPVISVQTNLVQLAVTVRDRAGRAVGGFGASDFAVFDNGKPRPIEFFSERREPAAQGSRTAANFAIAAGKPPEAPAPKSIALFIDDTHIDGFGLLKAKLAGDKFIDASLAPGDRMGLFTDSGTVTVDFTSDKKPLHAAIAQLRRHEQRAGGERSLTSCPTLTSYQAYVLDRHLDEQLRQAKIAEAIGCNCPSPDPGCIAEQPAFVQDLAANVWNQTSYQSTTVLDVLAIVVRQLARMPGTRILTMISPGFPAGGMERQRSAFVDAALRADITINALDSEGVGFGGITHRQVLEEFLADSAAATGGRFIKNTNDLAGGFQTVTAPPEVSYELAFTPAGEPDGQYHRLSVKLKNSSGHRLESRAGYFSAPLSERKESAQQRIDREALSNGRLEELPATVQVAAGAARNGRANIAVLIRVDANALKFSRQGDRVVEELTFATVLEDASGNYITGKLSVMDLFLRPATLANLKAKGIKAQLSFAAPRGSYRIRAVTREAVENRLATSSTPVDVP